MFIIVILEFIIVILTFVGNCAISLVLIYEHENLKLF